MKKIVLSALAALTLGSVAANAGALKLYQDANGQVFTQAGEGRTAIKTPTSVFSHADKLKFDGQAFIGYKNTDYTNSATQDTQGFYIGRGYLQLKAYLLDDPKSYYRITMDLKNSSAVDGNSLVVRAKYAYLYLNEVLPATGFEIGLAHRPWHDYEEHNSWLYRASSEILLENKNSAHLSSSADYGVMAKTRTKYFDSDIGIFNGEGYHGKQNSNGMSFEWRLTGHLLGTHGHPTKNTYLDASFFGQLNQKHYAVTKTITDYTVKDTKGNKRDVTSTKTTGYDDLRFYGFHTVFNMPAFLASAQYITSDNTASGNRVSKGAGDGYSFNIEGRIGAKHQYKAFARADKWTPDVVSGAKKYSRNTYIAGAAWRQNSNVEWVANVTVDNDEANHYADDKATANSTAYMLTAQVDF